MNVGRILETSLCAQDLDAAENFYRSVLGLQAFDRAANRHVFFRCGDGILLIFNPEATAHERVEIAGVRLPPHGTSGAGHMAFAINEADVASWREHLQRHGVSIEAEIVWPQGGRSIYFRDPAGNSLELATPKIWGLPE
jgi:catechol 2,3-dioxygenase-like lactoylglutathione lyase family enzyme